MLDERTRGIIFLNIPDWRILAVKALGLAVDIWHCMLRTYRKQFNPPDV